VSTIEEVTAKMRARMHPVPLPMLADILATLDAKPALDDDHRRVRAVVMDEICERCPEADAAFDAWADSDDNNSRNGSAAIVAAVRERKGTP